MSEQKPTKLGGSLARAPRRGSVTAPIRGSAAATLHREKRGERKQGKKKVDFPRPRFLAVWRQAQNHPRFSQKSSSRKLPLVFSPFLLGPKTAPNNCRHAPHKVSIAPRPTFYQPLPLPTQSALLPLTHCTSPVCFDHRRRARLTRPTPLKIARVPPLLFSRGSKLSSLGFDILKSPRRKFRRAPPTS